MPPRDVTASASPGPATTESTVRSVVGCGIRRQCGDPDLAQPAPAQGGLDRRARLAEVHVHLRHGLVTHDHDAMAER